MNNNLLQRVNNGNERQGSIKGPALAFYVVSLVVAFIAGGYYERAKTPEPPTHQISEVAPAPAPLSTPAEVATPPPAVASATPASHFTPPVLISSEQTMSAATPTRVERVVAVSPSVPVATPAAISTPAVAAATPAPAKQPGAVTMLEPVTDIPVKDGGKIVGYINLAKGQQIVPLTVENGQIKIKSGDRFAYVPVKATDMAH